MESFGAPSAYEYPLLIKQLLHNAVARAGDQEIFTGLDHRYSYATFRNRLGQLASGLRSLGVTPGDTVAVMDWDGYRYLECFFAIPMMGATLHTINIRLSPEQILFTINHAKDDVILVHEDFLPILAQIRDRIDRPVTLIAVKDREQCDEAPEGFATEYEMMLASADADFTFDDFDENTRATTFYTTGTTGDPKGVAYSHRQLVLHTLGLVAGFAPLAGPCRIHQRDVYMPITPMFHVHGWGFPYAATMLGMKQVYPGRYDPETIVTLIGREKVTFSHCVPTIMHMVLNAPNVGNVDLSGWKVVIGGSALSQGLAQTASEQGIEIFAAYGLSETCPLLTTAAVSEPSNITMRCQAGVPTPLVDLRVVDANMNDVPNDGESTGEIVARAPWLTQGYVDNQTGSDALWHGGYLHTGDVGRVTKNGALQITDRLKDVIKSGGEWVSSLELEDMASRSPAVSEVAAIGIPDERWGERPLLIVVRSEDTGNALSNDEVASEIRAAMQVHVDAGHLSRWAIPEQITFIDSIEKTSVGKLDKKALRARHTPTT